MRDDFSKNFNLDSLAETWECSTHPDGQSIVCFGVFTGQLLSDVLKRYPELAGTHPKMNNGLPVLVKFIDAKSDLSVQVHPSDDFAALYENGSWGKIEMWYIVEASKKAELVYGFRHDMDRNSVLKSLQEENLEKFLQKVPVKKGDIFLFHQVRYMLLVLVVWLRKCRKVRT